MKVGLDFQKFPEIQDDEVSNNPNAWFENGLALDGSERHLDAIKSYNKAIRIDPNFALALMNKGKSLIHLKIYDKAHQCLDASIKIYDKGGQKDLNLAKAWDNKAWAYLRANLRDYDKALQCVERALQIDPNLAIALCRKGLILQMLGKSDEANEYIDKAKRLGEKCI